MSLPLLATRNNIPIQSGVYAISNLKANATHISMHEASTYQVQGYNYTQFGLPDYFLLKCGHPSMLVEGVQSCIIMQNGTNDFVVFNTSTTNSSSLVTTASGESYGGLASNIPWFIQKSNTSASGYRIIKVPIPNEEPECVTLAPDIPVTPFLDGLGITVNLKKCLYDSGSKVQATYQDWCFNLSSPAPTSKANFRL